MYRTRTLSTRTLTCQTSTLHSQPIRQTLASCRRRSSGGMQSALALLCHAHPGLNRPVHRAFDSNAKTAPSILEKGDASDIGCTAWNQRLATVGGIIAAQHSTPLQHSGSAYRAWQQCTSAERLPQFYLLSSYLPSDGASLQSTVNAAQTSRVGGCHYDLKGTDQLWEKCAELGTFCLKPH